MEKIKCICVLRDIVQAMSQVEQELLQQYNVSLNEAMVLCCIGKETVRASFVKEHTGFTSSHTSKVIRSMEAKGLLIRALGEDDKRTMNFTLTPEGLKSLEALRVMSITMPDILQPLFESDRAE